MTVTMEDGRSVVMKKCVPELERRNKERKKESEAGTEEGEDEIQVQQVKPI